MAQNPPATSPGLRLQPLVHVRDMAQSITFYERLGGELVHGSPDADWVLMQLGTVQISLIARPPDARRGESTVELTFGVTAPLERMRHALRGAEVAVHPDRGEQLQLRSPDGLLITLREIEPDWYA